LKHGGLSSPGSGLDAKGSSSSQCREREREIGPVDGAADWTAVLQYGYQAVEDCNVDARYGALKAYGRETRIMWATVCLYGAAGRRKPQVRDGEISK
jgi:hypothetical protein